MEDTGVATAIEDQPNEALAKLEGDNSLMALGIVPAVAITVVFLVGFVLYWIRRKKTLSDLSEAMRIDDGDKPLGESGMERLSTREIANLEPTKPSQRLPDQK